MWDNRTEGGVKKAKRLAAANKPSAAGQKQEKKYKKILETPKNAKPPKNDSGLNMFKAPKNPMGKKVTKVVRHPVVTRVAKKK